MQLTFWTEEPLETTQEDSESLSGRSIGKAGEYIVAAELELAGYTCSFASEGLPYDLIVQRNDGSLCRIQVKTMMRPRLSKLPEGYEWRGYQFKSEPAFCDYQNVDVFAFVALDKRAATYIHASKISTKNVGIPEKRFINEPLRVLSMSQAISCHKEEGRGDPANP